MVYFMDDPHVNSLVFDTFIAFIIYSNVSMEVSVFYHSFINQVPPSGRNPFVKFFQPLKKYHGPKGPLANFYKNLYKRNITKKNKYM